MHADRCEDTCCAGWAIVIDDGTLKRYRRTGGSLGARLRREIRWKEKVFGAAGRSAAPSWMRRICAIFIKSWGKRGCAGPAGSNPRHIEEFENVRGSEPVCLLSGGGRGSCLAAGSR